MTQAETYRIVQKAIGQYSLFELADYLMWRMKINPSLNSLEIQGVNVRKGKEDLGMSILIEKRCTLQDRGRGDAMPSYSIHFNQKVMVNGVESNVNHVHVWARELVNYTRWNTIADTDDECIRIVRHYLLHFAENRPNHD